MTRTESKIEEKDVVYRGGQRVKHKSFGEGTVLSVNGSGSSAIVEIAFDSGANKKFAAAFAPIEIID